MIEERLAELEIKVSFQEDALSALNDVVYQQQNRIDALEGLLGRYRQYFDNGMHEPSGIASAGDEKPPHY